MIFGLGFLKMESHHEKHHEMERFGEEAAESNIHMRSPILREINQREAREVIELMSIHDASAVLEFGCGVGDLQPFLLSRYELACGFDISLSSLRYAKRRSPNVLQCDGDNLPFKETSFDAVVAKGVLHHLPDLPSSLKEIYRILGAGGMLMVDEPVADSHFVRALRGRFSQEHETWFESRSFLETLDLAGFKIEKVKKANYFSFGFGCLFRNKLARMQFPSWLARSATRAIFSIDKLFKLPWLENHNMGILVLCKKQALYPED